MRIVVALLLLIWAVFGCAVVAMMVYGVFDHTAFGNSVMAAILATGTAFLAGLVGFLSGGRAERELRSRR